MSEPVYRLATKSDSAAVAGIGAQIWDELGDGSGLPQRPTNEGIASLIANQRGGVFICESGGTRPLWASGLSRRCAGRGSVASSL